MSTPLRKFVPTHSATGKKWKSSRTIKKHLRKDFNARCAYCDDPDYIVDIDFHIEHFAPKTKFPERKIDYGNLLYSCPYCNGAKSEYWVSNDPDVNVIGSEGIVNPCSKSYECHLGRLDNGRIYPMTQLGDFMYKQLKLYLLRHEVFFKLENLRNKIRELKILGCGDNLGTLCEELLKYYDLASSVKWERGPVEHVRDKDERGKYDIDLNKSDV